MEAKLLDTKRKMEKSQLLEVEAQEKLVEVRGQLEKQKAESIETKELFCSALNCFIGQLKEDKKKSDQVLVSDTSVSTHAAILLLWYLVCRPTSELLKRT